MPERPKHWLIEERPAESEVAVARADALIFHRLYPALRRFAAIWAPPGTEPDDLLQQAVANALARRPLSELDDPGAYLRTTIANVARNLYRRTVEGELVPLAEPTHEDTYPSDLAELERLNPEDRAALYLIEVEGMTYVEAAPLLGCSPEALRARAMRARARLRAALTDGGD